MKKIQIGTATLIHGDCEEFMSTLPDKSFDLAVVDPPYGIGEDGSKDSSRLRPTAKWKKPKCKGYKAGGWDNAIPQEKYFNELMRASNDQVIWGGNYFRLPATPCWIVWDKKTSGDFADGELAWVSFNKALRIFTHLWSGFKQAVPEQRIHPTQKPVKLYEWIYANYAKPGQTILDTHGGSMSSVIAALNMGFEITCIEKDEDYFNAAVERVIKSQQQQKLF